MKGKVLKIFAAILGISGAILVLVNIFYLLSGSGVYWTPQHDFLVPDLVLDCCLNVGLSDLQLSNQLHIPFLLKTLCLLAVSALVWLRARKLLEHEKAAWWVLLFPLAAAVGSAFISLALWLLREQELFLYKNHTVNVITTLSFVLIGALLIKASLSLLIENRAAIWLMLGFFLAATANEFANLLAAIAYPFLKSTWESRYLLEWWYLRLGIEALLYLFLFGGASLLLIWLRSELSETPSAGSEEMDGKSALGLN